MSEYLDWPTVAIRLALYMVLAMLFGVSVFSLYGLRPGEREDAVALRPRLSGSAALGLLLLAAGLILMPRRWPDFYSGRSTRPQWLRCSEGHRLAPPGRSVWLRWSLPGARGGAWLAVAMIAAATALATLAWNAHGAMDEGSTGWLHLGADILHLLAGGIWVGALFGLLLLMTRRAEAIDAAHLRLTHRALHGFGAVGPLVVAI
jgi:putative copper resistance protein D